MIHGSNVLFLFIYMSKGSNTQRNLNVQDQMSMKTETHCTYTQETHIHRQGGSHLVVRPIVDSGD